MTATVIVGAQWGDEGKGKIVDFLASRARAVVRAQGGSNAGHTVVNDFGEFRLHAVPSGIFHDGVSCIMGPGTVIDPDALVAELREIEAAGVSTEGLVLSDRAHIVMPYHLEQERLEEASLGRRKIGTTGRGIGPAYADKHARFGLRLGDLLREDWLAERLRLVADIKSRHLEGLGAEPVEVEPLLERCSAWASTLSPKIRDSTALLAELLEAGEEIIVEGQLGAMRDIDHGIYPFVTSSAPCAAGLCQGAGISPLSVGAVLGVVKAYSTSVGAGPMVAELRDATGERLRELGHEYGASTGRPRRCGWLDLPALRASARLNRYTGLAVTRLDVLDSLQELRICVAYDVDGERVEHAPSTAAQERARPILETVPGWQKATTEARTLEALPRRARAYLDRIVHTMGAPLDIVSVGPARSETIVVKR